MRRATCLGVTWLLSCGLAACGGGGETQGQAMEARPEIAAVTADDRGVLNKAPVVARVQLSPMEPSPGDLVVARVDASDADGDPVELVYQWHIDGRRQASGVDTLHVENAVKGSRIELTVVARDGRDQSAPVIASTRVGNSPPVLQGVIIEPLGEITASQDVTASPTARDPDGDDIEFEYRWTVNGEAVNADGPVLASSNYARGDSIGLAVAASDGQDESDPIESEGMVVANARPRITSAPGAIGDDGVFRYQIQTEDPDGDRMFRYRLNESPDGMQLDIVHGRLSWEPRASQVGIHEVAIEVDDRSGGVATQSFTIQVELSDAIPASAAP